MSKIYQPGTVVFDSWSIQRKLGEGSFGRVFEIQREDFGQVYRAALKVITVPQSEAELQSVMEEGMNKTQAEQYFYSVVEDIVREFAIMARLKGTANIVGYEDHVVIRHTNGIGWDILIRMELLTPLLPYAYQHPLSRRDIIRIGIDLCRALELCQKYNIIHRDIKPENIFVSDNGDFKLGDFGIARTIEKTTSGLSKKGTYSYMAPEVYRGEKYGFSVDIYSLGILLYRLLNQNRTPFLPSPPEPITFRTREQALARRMSGEVIQPPFHGEGRLAEIVLKACSFDPKDRYSSPSQMRQELETIVYDQEDAELIYPDGDELTLDENQYVSQTPERVHSEGVDKTQSMFGAGRQIKEDNGGTASIFSSRSEEQEREDGTQSIFGNRQQKSGQKWAKAQARRGKSKIPAILAATACLILLAGGALALTVRSQHQQQAEQAAKNASYQKLMQDGSAACKTDPEQAAKIFLEAQKLRPEESAPYVSYAYALYCAREYDACISYIEDDMAMGKNYAIETQNILSEILGASYFEQEDYAAAASFFRLSTAGGDITVSAMRDYAVSLGRLGDISTADEILQRMLDAGASDDVTNYVKAEIDFAQEDYLSAEAGFQAVLSDSEDVVLQKRALRSLAEVYRDCSALSRINASPISRPATREAELLADGIVKYGLRHDSTLWEMLALAYFEAYHTDPDVSENYLTKAAECFNLVIELGISKDYLYTNLYSVYYEMKDYTSAEQALSDYEQAFPKDYTPHALRAIMLITLENEKGASVRDYRAALKEYQLAGEMLGSSDDATYYQQLESLVQQLESAGWL